MPGYDSAILFDLDSVVVIVNFNTRNSIVVYGYFLHLKVWVHDVDVAEEGANSGEGLGVLAAPVVAHHVGRVPIVPDRPQILGNPLEEVSRRCKLRCCPNHSKRIQQNVL
jgi:hypothetical protein